MTVVSTRATIGRAVRRARVTRRLTQRALGARACVSASVVGSLERGELGCSMDTVDRIARALGLRVLIGLDEPIVLDRAAPEDLAHARCVAALRRLLERNGINCAVEQPVATAYGRGWIDLLGYESQSRRLVVIEVKTVLDDLGALQRQVETYSRGCLTAARALGWTPRAMLVAVIVLATADADVAAVLSRSALSREFPVRGREASDALLDGGPVRGRALLAIDPLRPGRRMLTSLRIDGRRSPAPYRNLGEFIQRLGSTGRRGTQTDVQPRSDPPADRIIRSPRPARAGEIQVPDRPRNRPRSEPRS